MMIFSPSIYDRFGGFVIVTLINLPHFKGFCFCRLYSSSVAFIRGQCNFLPSTTYYRHRNRTDGDYRTQSFKGTPVGIHEKCMSADCTWMLPWAEALRIWQWQTMVSYVSITTKKRNIWMNVCMLICILQTQWGWSQPLGCRLPLTPKLQTYFLPYFLPQPAAPLNAWECEGWLLVAC